MKRSLPPLEKDEARAIKALLTAVGFRVWSTSQGRRSRVTAGLPDLYAVRSGQALWVEVKQSGEKRRRPAQEEFALLHQYASNYCVTGDRETVRLALVRLGLLV